MKNIFLGILIFCFTAALFAETLTIEEFIVFAVKKDLYCTPLRNL